MSIAAIVTGTLFADAEVRTGASDKPFAKASPNPRRVETGASEVPAARLGQRPLTPGELDRARGKQ